MRYIVHCINQFQTLKEFCGLAGTFKSGIWEETLREFLTHRHQY